ncbi:Yip1 family protein [Salinicola halophilus]|uniref:Yip1 family protein n=1 Tax=Salinicola halophilus TaxID=184065 RepID=UPI000DA1D431|nr:Yip1 family protein [Salinicola halophilus]
MIHHVWGLMAHPKREWQKIRGEDENVIQLFGSHVAILAAIPVLCSLIGTTFVGWHFGESVEGQDMRVQLSAGMALVLAALFYALILGAVYLMGFVIHWLAARFESRPSLQRCTVFAGHMATPLFLSGIVTLYPLVWLCVLALGIGLAYTAYLVIIGLPHFLGIDRQAGLRAAGAWLAVGVLVLEALLAITIFIGGYGANLVAG